MLKLKIYIKLKIYLKLMSTCVIKNLKNKIPIYKSDKNYEKFLDL